VLQSERPAVILLDIGLPDAVGTSTLEWLQTLRPDIPVIVLTGNTDQRLARQMRQRGAFDYITKPFEIEHLERSLQAAVSTASP
jgi:FixJ family two-component response regulator